MSDVDVMAAIIQKHAVGADYTDRKWRATDFSVKRAAEALCAAGFIMGAGTVDKTQNERLRLIEDRLTRVEGWAGIAS